MDLPAYRSLIEECPDAVIVTDRDGVVELWNAGAEATFGHAARDIVGKTLDIIIPEGLRERHWTGYRAVMASGKTRYGSEVLKVPATHRDGRRLSIEFRIVLLRDASGTVTAAGAFLRDVTAAWEERRRLLDRIAALESDRAAR